MATTVLSSNWKKLQSTLQSSSSSSSSQTNPPVRDTQNNAGVKRKRNNSLAFTSSTSRASAGNAHPSEQRPAHRSRHQGRKMVSSGEISLSTPATSKKSIQDAENADSDIPTRRVLSAAELVNAGLSPSVELGRYVAIDCEMVGVGPNPDRESALARVSVVNYNGEQVYDSYVLPKEPVTDWRTAVSGILPKHMHEARSLEEVQMEITKIMKDRILIGHAIHHDLEALMLSHPKRDIRDTSRHAPYRKLAGGSWPRLKILTSELLGFEIQDGAHSSVEDARACMLLFRKDKAAFEREHSKRWPVRLSSEPPSLDGQSPQSKPRKKKKKKKH